MNKLILTGAVAVCAIYSASAFGHHSSAPHFDHDQTVTVVGTVEKVRLVNPHAYIYFSESKGGESVSWRCELSSATQLRRWGWTADMFVPGQKITVTGSPARREDNVCYAQSLTLADGTVLDRHGDLTEGQDAVATAAAVEIERPRYLENGQPNLTGPWRTKSFGRDGEGVRPQYVASEAGKVAVGSYDVAYDDPILRCHIVNIIGAWNHDENVNEITQSDDLITIQYGFMDFVRTVHLGMGEHPSGITPSAGGHSIGRWDGDTLVIDTVGFEAGVLEHRSGQKHSDQMHIVERFYFDEDRQYLVRDYTLEDPLYLVGVTKGQDFMAIADAPYTPYNCVELSGKNNIRPEELPVAEPEEKPWWQFWD